jgi:hypothetical protein
MANSTDRKAVSQITQGFRVSRSTATLPQTAQSALFTVAGGRVLVLGIVGQVTTIIENQANNTKIVANPTTGSDVDLCAVLSIANDEVGCLYGITGVASDAMVGSNAGATVWPTRPTVVAAGTIDLNCAASNTGSVKWDIWYLPLDDGAYITAA